MGGCSLRCPEIVGIVSKKSPDYQTGIGGIIPSSQTSNSKDKVTLKIFREKFKLQVLKDIEKDPNFPTQNELIVLIIQFFISKYNYDTYDIDNISKTILDVLKLNLCKDDKQVKVLLAAKLFDKQVPENFAYVECRELKGASVPNILKENGYQKAVIYYQTEVALKKG